VACCSFDNSVDRQFGEKNARRQLRRYHRHGAGGTAKMLLAGLAKARLTEGTVLDVGAGIGSVTFELLERGVEHAVIVEASAAYAAAASTEAARRGRGAAVRVVRGNLLDVADQVPSVEIVTLDRVVCCYPRYEELLATALERAEDGFAFSYPRERWFMRTAIALANALLRTTSGFRTFVHSERAMRRLIERAGFELVSHSHNMAWSADVFVRRVARAGRAATFGTS
jgi:tRNA1(Val) A37 N6-methylase TrmN6